MQNLLDPKREQTLIEQARHQPDAFRELYRAYFPRVYAYVAYRVRREQDAEDLTADIFMKVVEAFPQFTYRGEGSFSAWLFRIAGNRVNQFYRLASEALSLSDLPDIGDSTEVPDQIVIQKERFAHLSRLINTLSPRRREIVLMRFFGGLRNQEIAVVLALDERTVAAHLSRALDDLQQMYRAEAEKEKTE